MAMHEMQMRAALRTIASRLEGWKFWEGQSAARAYTPRKGVYAQMDLEGVVTIVGGGGMDQRGYMRRIAETGLVDEAGKYIGPIGDQDADGPSVSGGEDEAQLREDMGGGPRSY